MKKVALLALVIVFLMVVTVTAQEEAPIAISPGNDMGVAVVGQSTPTFSWTAVDWATAYRVEVFVAPDSQVLPYKEMAAQSYPVLVKEIRGAATGWTPSADEQLRNSGAYVWYVQAIDEFGTSSWSEGKAFTVNLAAAFAPIEKTMSDSLKEHGISEEVIEDVLNDVKTKVGEQATAASTDNPPPISVQGTETADTTLYGYNAGFSLTASGDHNAFFGDNTGYSVTTGDHNTFLGAYAGYSTTYADLNTYVGWSSGQDNTSGSNNTYLGAESGLSNQTGNNNVMLGYYAGANNTVSENIFVGYRAGYANTTGQYNTFVGYRSGDSNTTASANSFFGYNAGYGNTTGYSNVFLGAGAGYSNTTGIQNLFLGKSAGYDNTTGSNNTYVGIDAGYNNDEGGSNVHLGYRAGWMTIGSGNIFLGHRAAEDAAYISNQLFIDNSNTSDPLVWGDFSTDTVALMGTVGVGTKTPAFPMEMKKTGTNASIVVDRTDGATNYINATDSFGNFGTVTNHPLRLVVNSQWKMRVNSDLSLTMRNGASCTAAGVWTNASSRDLKENIEELSVAEAEEALAQLDPVSYNYKTDETDKYVGFIAEDVPDLVASKDRKGMSPMDVVAVLTKVVQEQQKINQILLKRIEELESKNKDK